MHIFKSTDEIISGGITPDSLIKDECLKSMELIQSKSVDLILCDLPYGTLKCTWDVIIPFDKLWTQYERIIKDNGAIVLFGSEPFSSLLRTSNLKLFRYDWIWDKNKAGNFAQSGYQPMKIHETVSVFYKNKSVYNPQKTQLDKPQTRHLGKKSVNRNDRAEAGGISGGIKYSENYEPDKKLPTSILNFAKDNYKSNVHHPSQKPVSICEYFIKTYTNEGDVVLDNCMGSGTTGIAAKNTNRKFIGIEKDDKYFETAVKRINNLQDQLLEKQNSSLSSAVNS